jgi:RNA polymerase sigma-70 factor (ECF subfamily)
VNPDLSSPEPRPDRRSDLDLIAVINSAAGRGDQQAAAAFEVLYLRYRDWVVSTAYRITGDRDAALDVMQETFLYLLGKFPGFELTAQLKTFLYPAIRHLAIASNQKARRFAGDAEALESVPAGSGASPAADGAEGLGDLAAVLAVLPVGQREVLVLRFVDGLALQEIAQALGVPLGTVKSRLHNALDSLRGDPRTQAYFEV